MNANRRLWIGLWRCCWPFRSAYCCGSAGEIHRVMPPIPASSRHRARRNALHARRHRDRPPGLAVHRRPAARLDLGPRRLRRAGLDCRLAASRSRRMAGHRSRSARLGTPYAELSPRSRRLRGTSCGRTFAQNTLRSGDATRSPSREDRAAAIAQVAATTRAVRRRSGAARRCARRTR